MTYFAVKVLWMRNAVKWLEIMERRSELLCCELDILIKMSNWRYFNTDIGGCKEKNRSRQ